MPACALIVAIVASVSALPTLPALEYLYLSVIVFAVGGYFSRYLKCSETGHGVWAYALIAFVAVVWSLMWGHRALDNRLSPDLEGQSLVVVGTVESLPVDSQWGQRFFLRVESWRRFSDVSEDHGSVSSKFPKRIRLNWRSDENVKAGMRSTLRVKLKRPHGHVNLGGFDYERWLMSRGIGATGYVQSWAGNSLQEQHTWVPSIHRLRQDLRERIMREGTESIARSLALALMTGDKSAITEVDRRRLQYLGLAHLLAISGLHIGLAATVGLLLGKLIGRLLNRLFPMDCFTPVVALCCAWLVAAGYALLAGLSLPTQRALLMLTVWVLVSLSGRRFSPWFSWWLALAAVFVCFPLSLFDLGAWLSFGAVAVLIATFQGRWFGPASSWRDLLRAQWVLFFALGLLQWVAGLPVSLVSPLVNAVVIPYVAVAVVPVLLLMATVALVSDALFGLGFGYALMPLEFLIWCLEEFEKGLLVFGGWESWLWHRTGAINRFAQALLLGIVLLMLLPLPRTLKTIALMGLSALIVPAPKSTTGIEIVVLDVGQGLAIAVHEQGRHHLIDVGREFHGERVLLPYFRYRGVSELNTVAVSHGDADHAGGLPLLINTMQVGRIWIQPEDAERWLPSVANAGDTTGYAADNKEGNNEQLPLMSCADQPAERWGNIAVRRFGAGKQAYNNANNRSCVLLLEYAGVRVLLPGDIEWGREQQLLMAPELAQPVDILVAPHHGSRTSSGTAWVQRLAPDWVVFSAGYRNQYGHPADGVVERYRNVGSMVLNTAESGAIHFVITPDGRVMWNTARNLRKRYWM